MTRKIAPISVWNRGPMKLICCEVVVDHHEEERADPGTLQAVEPADHGDHEHVDRRTEVDRRRVDVPVPPDEEDARNRSDERRRTRRRSSDGATTL